MGSLPAKRCADINKTYGGVTRSQLLGSLRDGTRTPDQRHIYGGAEVGKKKRPFGESFPDDGLATYQ